MWESRWIDRTVPGLVAIVVFGVMASTSLGAPERPWVPAACAGTVQRHAEADGTWYRLDPILDVGARRGQRLVVGRGDGDRPRVMDLASESFAAGPFGGLVLVGSDDGAHSTLSLVDVVAGCAWPVGTSGDVIRRATLTPDGATMYEARVARDTRADLGIWRRSLSSEPAPVRVLPAIDPDGRFGRTWSTDFVWSEDGADLAVQSCGEIACRTRILEPATGDVRGIADPGLGELVGLTADRLIAHGACRGFPCPLLSVRIDDGHVDFLHPEAGQAVMVATPEGGSRVVLETSPDGRSLRSMDVTGADARDVAAPLPGLQLVPRPGRSGGAMEIERSWLIFGPGGRLPLADAGEPLFRRIGSDRLVPLAEVVR